MRLPCQISININNNGTIALRQQEHDGAINLIITHDGFASEEHAISPGDMVMLMNYYRNCKAGLEASDYIPRN